MRIAHGVVGMLTGLALGACGQSDADESTVGASTSTKSSAGGSSSGPTESSTVGSTTNGQVTTTASTSASSAGGSSGSGTDSGSDSGSGGATQANAATGGAAGSDSNGTTGDDGAVHCVPKGAFCRALPGPCPDFQVREVDGDCWGACVPIEECVCDEPADCPDENQYTCHNSAGRCGPYLM